MLWGHKQFLEGCKLILPSKSGSKNKESPHCKFSLSPHGSGSVSFVWGTVLVRLSSSFAYGGGSRGRDGVLWRGFLILALKFGIKHRNKNKKKGLRRKILGYYSAFTQFDLLFCPRKKFYSLLGGTNSDFGGTVSKCQLVALRLLLSLGVQSLLGGGA